jgi:hypothetical protein
VSAWSIEYLVREGSSCLVTKPLLGGVAALAGPHAVTARSGPKAIGPMMSGLITPRGAVLSSDHSYLMMGKLLRRFALLQWRRFESVGRGVPFTGVDGEKPLSTDLKGPRVRCSRTFWGETTRCL